MPEFSERSLAEKREHQNEDNPPLSLLDLIEHAPKVAKKIDLDKDGTVGMMELAMAVDNPYITGRDAQAVAVLFRLNRASQERHVYESNLAPLQELRVDKIGDDIRTLMAVGNGANRFERTREGVLERPIVPLDFDIIDTNKDKLVDRKELQSARENKVAPANELNVTSQLYFNLQKQALKDGLPFSGLTRKDVEDLKRVWIDIDVPAKYLALDTIIRTTEAQINLQTARPFADKEHPLDSIVPEAINQGRIGNCFFEAALASVAQQDPKLIYDMIEERGNGVYKVTFPGDKDRPMYVTTPSDANLGLFNRSTELGLWPNILENAYGQYLMQTEQGQGPNGLKARAEGAAQGGRPEDVIRLLTGKDAQDQRLLGWASRNDETVEHMANTLAEGLKDGRVITAATGSAADLPKEDFAKGILDHHAYSILGALKENGKTYFIVRDPWGEGSPKEDGSDGTFMMEARNLLKTFRSLQLSY